MSSILDAVRLGFNQAGLQLLPVKNDGSKAPDVSSWTEFKTTRATLEQMRAWKFAARSGFGVVGGAVSGCVDPWDFDCYSTFEAFLEAADACGLGDVVRRIRAGYEVETPGGGRRWLLRYPADLPFQDVVLARRPGGDDEPKVKTLVEITTFSIVAPSNGHTHPSKKPYVQLAGNFSTLPSYTREEREALMALARTFDQMPRPQVASHKISGAGKAGNRPGDDLNQRMTWAQLLEPHGWTLVFERGGVEYWRRPGKSHGISGTTNFGGSDLFFPFTSSSEFDPEKSYSKFAVYALFEHGGDFGRAALALRRQGYGDSTNRGKTRQADQKTPEPASGVTWRWLADVQREYVSWLWPTRLAKGTLALWIGDGGLGKSRASNDIAARVTTGAPWPDQGVAEVGSVVILSAEDSASYTIRPAIEAADGDLSRVAVLDAVRDKDGTERTFNLATDVIALEELIATTGASLVIIDPLSAYFGTKLDSYRDTDVRAVLEPIVKLAERRHVAILGIMHVGKGTDRQARHRALGSVAFVNAARLVFAVGPDPEDASRRLLVPVKANLCREAPALAFRLEDANGVARVTWEAAPAGDVSADVVLSGKPTDVDDERQDADSLLRQLLEDETWPLPASAIEAAGRAHGIHVRSLQRAARRIGIRITKKTFRGGWMWYAPDVPAEDDTSADQAQQREDDSVSSSVRAPHEDDTTPKMTRRRQCISVSSSEEVSSSESESGSQDDMSSSVVFVKSQQNTPICEDDTTESTRAREADDVLPACLMADEAPLLPTDAEAPFADHDDAPRRVDPWANLPRPPGSLEAAAAVATTLAAGGLRKRRRR